MAVEKNNAISDIDLLVKNPRKKSLKLIIYSRYFSSYFIDNHIIYK